MTPEDRAHVEACRRHLEVGAEVRSLSGQRRLLQIIDELDRELAAAELRADYGDPVVSAPLDFAVDRLQVVADLIKNSDGGDPSTETGWASEEYLDTWLKINTAIEKIGGPA